MRYKNAILAPSNKPGSGMLVLAIMIFWPIFALLGFGYWVGRFFEGLDGKWR